ncbi:MAG TPA: glycoside hydrolase family 99-like domain-containing protein [Caldilineaceae bacterium]|nr:glycoside hydrolase family 99-like domain-containing protein [Caldilineaceae bacterium]
MTVSLRLPEDLASLVDLAQAARPDALTVACFVFPQWHRSALNDRLYAPGWTEYAQLRGARPWFPGHHQPRTPLLGELDERDPATWETYVDLAVTSGIDTFIFDWYWFDNGPALHEALEEGFLCARNRNQMRFAAAWINHPWAIWFPTAGAPPAAEWLALWETSGLGSYEPSYPCPESQEEIWRSIAYLMARYFHLPNYWRINEKPVLPLWDLSLLINRFGVQETHVLLDDLQSFARKLGHPGVHFHAVCQEPAVLPILDQLAGAGVNSYGLYNALAQAVGGRPHEEELPDYGMVAADVVTKVWPQVDAASTLPCFPIISPGADNAPRVLMRPRPAQPSRAKWPGTVIVVDETPAAFEALTRAALAYLAARPEIPPVITIGCWNEWTEGHYLLPDTKHGYGMARALARGLQVER